MSDLEELQNRIKNSFKITNKYIKETGKDFSNRYGYTGEFTEWLMDLIVKSGVIDVWN
jgi:hypothetical protein